LAIPSNPRNGAFLGFIVDGEADNAEDAEDANNAEDAEDEDAGDVFNADENNADDEVVGLILSILKYSIGVTGNIFCDVLLPSKPRNGISVDFIFVGDDSEVVEVILSILKNSIGTTGECR
jgi:hypothetical protein